MPERRIVHERGQRAAVIGVDAGGHPARCVRHELRRVAARVDVAARLVEPAEELERGVTEHRAQSRLGLLGRRLVRHLTQEARPRPVEPRLKQSGEEEQRDGAEGDEGDDAQDVPGRVGHTADEEERGDERRRDAAGEVHGAELAPLRRGRTPPPPDEQHDHAHEDHEADDGEDRLERVGRLRVVGDEERVVRAALAVVELAIEDRGQRSGKEGGDPEARDHPPLQPRAELPLGVSEHQVDERGEEERPEDRGEPENPARVGLEEGIDEPEEADEQEKQARAVVRPDHARDHSAHSEDDPDHRQDDGLHGRVPLVIAARGQNRGKRRQPDDRRDHPEPQPVPGQLHFMSAATAAPVSSFFGRKPRAPLPSTREP